MAKRSPMSILRTPARCCQLAHRDEAHRIEGEHREDTAVQARRGDVVTGPNRVISKSPNLRTLVRDLGRGTTMHIRQNPTAGLSARAALLWIAVISVVMTLAVVFADHTPPKKPPRAA